MRAALDTANGKRREITVSHAHLEQQSFGSGRSGGGSVHLDVRGREEARGRRARGEEVGGGDEGGDDEGDGGEEPEGVLDAGEGVVHGG